MLKGLLVAAMMAAALLKPIDEMSLEEVAQRMAELTMEIMVGGGGTATPEQEAEMAALEARLDELTGNVADRAEAEADKMEAEGSALIGDQPPEQTPIDAIGRAFQKALPHTWEGKSCNIDVKDTYRNLTPWFKSQGIDQRGQEFSRTCGDRTDAWYSWEIVTFDVGEVSKEGFRPELVQPENRKLIEFTALCGHDAMITEIYNIVSVNIDGKAEFGTNASYRDDQAPGVVLNMQRRMADAVDCDVISRALGQP